MVKTMYIRVLVALFFIIGGFAFGAPARAALLDSQLDDSAQALRPPDNYYYVDVQDFNYLSVGYVPTRDLSVSGIRFRMNTSLGNYVCPLIAAVMQHNGTSTPAIWSSGDMIGAIRPVATTTPDASGNCDYATFTVRNNVMPHTLFRNHFYIFLMKAGETPQEWVSMSGKPYASSTPQNFLGYRPATDDRYVWGTTGLDAPYFEFFDTTPPAPDPCADSTCASSVLFIPGMKGSVLKINDDAVWPPSFWSDDLPKLALTAEGGSVNPVVVDGVLETFYGTPIYSGFMSFMDGLVASGTTTEWKALAYDWRFSPERILADGIKTPAGTVDPIEEIETLAARSETGKVTIVAHSMGGLLGKAIIQKLQDEGKENLIDSFIMVGVPQLGTPQAVASLLHSDGEGIGAGLIVHAGIVREIAQNFQSAYDLLPSPRYFNEVAEPIITFDPNAVFTQAWRDYWGLAIDSYTEFFSFITGGGVARINPEFTRLQIPEILRTGLAENARDFHNVYDTYTFPDSIRVVQVAGWGVPTTKAIKYKTRHFRQNYEPLFTVEGDNTVVYPSAVSSVADETYFFNLEKYRREEVRSIQHRDLLDSSPIQQILASVIKNENVSQTQYVVTAKPITDNLADQLVVSTHSPVILGAYDQNGRFSGINPNQDLEADVLLITEDIPGSIFLSFGDSQYLFLPKEGSYSVVFQGVGTGPTDVEIENLANDTSTLAAIYSDIPVSASTSATFMINSASPQDAHMQVDSNNDGRVDTYVAPDNQSLAFNELLTNLETAVQNIAASEKLKTDILKKMRGVEKKIAKQKDRKASKAVMGLEKRIGKKAAKGGLSNAEAAEITRLLGQIENAL